MTISIVLFLAALLVLLLVFRFFGWKLGLKIGLVFFAVLAAITASAATAIYCWFWLVDFTLRFGLPQTQAYLAASILVVPVLLAINLIFSFVKRVGPLPSWWKSVQTNLEKYFPWRLTSRWHFMGLVMLAAIVLGFFLWLQENRGKLMCFTPKGEGTTYCGYTITTGDSPMVTACELPGMSDQDTGLPCRPVIPEVAAYLKEAKETEAPLWIEHPQECFRRVDGRPKIWVCWPTEDRYRLATIPLYDPASGKLCEPITPKFCQEHQRSAEEAKKKEREAEEANRRAEAERLPRSYFSLRPVTIGSEGVAKSTILVPDNLEIRRLEIKFQSTIRTPCGSPSVLRHTCYWLAKDESVHEITIEHPGHKDIETGESVSTRITAFDGQSSKGLWTLMIRGSGGWLDSWSIIITPTIAANGSIIQPAVNGESKTTYQEIEERLLAQVEAERRRVEERQRLERLAEKRREEKRARAEEEERYRRKKEEERENGEKYAKAERIVLDKCGDTLLNRDKFELVEYCANHSCDDGFDFFGKCAFLKRAGRRAGIIAAYPLYLFLK